MAKCEMCDNEAELKPILYFDDEDKMLCSKCWDYECGRGDMEYERQKEEGIEDERA